MKKSVVIGLFILLIAFYIYRVYKVNTEFESVKEKIIPFGQETEISEGISMKVNKYRMISGKEASKYYDYDYNPNIRDIIILVNVTYYNNTKESKIVDTRPAYIEKTGFSTATEMMLYKSCNSFGLDVELKAGEKKNVILPYILYEFQFKRDEWEKIDKEVFYISNSRYPIKTKWLLR